MRCVRVGVARVRCAPYYIVSALSWSIHSVQMQFIAGEGAANKAINYKAQARSRRFNDEVIYRYMELMIAMP